MKTFSLPCCEKKTIETMTQEGKIRRTSNDESQHVSTLADGDK